MSRVAVLDRLCKEPLSYPSVIGRRTGATSPSGIAEEASPMRNAKRSRRTRRMFVISVLRRARGGRAPTISRTIGQGGDVGGLFRATRRRLALVAVLALVGAGIAYAAIPDSSGVIHGCYSTKNGALRVIDSSAKCANGEVALNWNQQGPK